jgi:acylphosphatase
MTKTFSIVVSGKVQGVFYRQSTKEFAASLDLKGEVRNMPDDTVEIIATGLSENIEKLIKWCWQGPPKAIVTNVTVKEIPERSFDKFRIVR